MLIKICSTLGNWKQITHPFYLSFFPSSALLFRLHSLLCALHNKTEDKQKFFAKRVGYLFPVALNIIFISSCASIISQSDYHVTINSTPNGATFEIKNQKGVKVADGITPKQVILTTKAGFFDGETYSISYNKDGYKTGFLVLDTQLDNWYYGNILFAGIGSFTVDPYTGAMWALPKESSTSLEKQPTHSRKIDKKWHIK